MKHIILVKRIKPFLIFDKMDQKYCFWRNSTIWRWTEWDIDGEDKREEKKKSSIETINHFFPIISKFMLKQHSD